MKKLCYLLLVFSHYCFAQTNSELWNITTSESIFKHLKGDYNMDTYPIQNTVLSELYTIRLTSLSKDYFGDNNLNNKLTPPKQQTSTCYGYINIATLLENYQDYKTAELKIASLEKNYQLEIAQMESELSKKLALYSKEANSKTQTENDVRAEEVEQIKQHNKNRIAQINDEFDTKSNNIKALAIANVRAAIKKVASQHSLSIVLDISVINEQNTLVSEKGVLFSNAINLLFDVEKELGITTPVGVQAHASENTSNESTVCFGYLDWNALYKTLPDKYPSIAATLKHLEDSYKLEISKISNAYQDKVKRYSDEASLKTDDENSKRAKELEKEYEHIKSKITQLQNDLETKSTELYTPAFENVKATVQTYINMKNIPYVIDASFIDDNYFIIGNSKQFFQLGLNLMGTIKKELGFN